MLDLYGYLQASNDYKKLQINDLLFIEYKCLVEEVRAGIWSDANYFVFVTSGKKMWRSIENDYIVEAGDSLFVKKGANLVHQFFDEDYCALMVFIPDDFIKKFIHRFSAIVSKTVSNNESQTDAVIRIQLDTYLEAYINSLAAFLSSPSYPDKNLLHLKFEELLLNIFTNPIHKELACYLLSINKEQSAQIQQIMEENYAYCLNLDQYAELCNMSLSTFKRNFQELYKTSPGKWLANKRLDLASHLLKTTDKPINLIGFECGFEDPSSFTRAFKLRFNCTPVHFRSTVIS
ncbi:helix-turn-helix domain-containing protein [Marinigracilibium pacificum]|uniref:Helix-turn-helix transcriptional regulator n=1 Tax=Marinigracilibium pacificum TaxID=2729599 RepID=A0A848J8H4_9BACT|nr:AraC family transcriptional regulator [Marinigracilibium pacificum]NMM50790.1 helix-turn-helix transcriptional regulator [Marinigracilibium pacificum]